MLPIPHPTQLAHALQIAFTVGGRLRIESILVLFVPLPPIGQMAFTHRPVSQKLFASRGPTGPSPGSDLLAMLLSIRVADRTAAPLAVWTQTSILAVSVKELRSEGEPAAALRTDFNRSLYPKRLPRCGMSANVRRYCQVTGRSRLTPYIHCAGCVARLSLSML